MCLGAYVLGRPTRLRCTGTPDPPLPPLTVPLRCPPSTHTRSLIGAANSIRILCYPTVVGSTPISGDSCILSLSVQRGARGEKQCGASASHARRGSTQSRARNERATRTDLGRCVTPAQRLEHNCSRTVRTCDGRAALGRSFVRADCSAGASWSSACQRQARALWRTWLLGKGGRHKRLLGGANLPRILAAHRFLNNIRRVWNVDWAHHPFCCTACKPGLWRRSGPERVRAGSHERQAESCACTASA